MKFNYKNIGIIIILFLAVDISCKKDMDFLTVSEACNLNYPDSSDQNPKAQDFKELLDKYVQKGIPGLLLLVKTPEEGLWVGASGYSNIETKTNLKKCNIAYSASIGKTYYIYYPGLTQ